MSTLLIDGREQGGVPAGDRGLAYGDGVFETLRLSAGRPRLLERHLQRLQQGCGRLGFEAPASSLLMADIEAVAAAAPPDGVVKLIVTRGDGGRGYRPPPAPRARRIVSAHPAPAYDPAWWTEGVSLRICATRLGRNPALAGIKHLNRLEQVLARREWDDPEVPEGLMLDDAGHLVCGTQSNLFVLRDGTLMTPALDACGVAGVMRGFVLSQAASLGLRVGVGAMKLEVLEEAQEIFLTNAVIGIWPVRATGVHAFAPGVVAARMQQCLARETA